MALKMLLANALSGSCKCGRAAARISTRYTPACTAASTSAPTAAFASALRQASQRGIVTSAARSALGDVLQKELEYEKSNYEVPTEARSTPAGWQLVDEEGSSHLTLTKKFNEEQINIEVMCDEQPEEPAYEDEEGNPVDPEDDDLSMGVEYSVHVTKGDQTLVFECVADGSGNTINNVTLEPTKYDSNEESSAYEGPSFPELDPGLQHEFDQYLTQRGINTDLTNYLVALVNDKEQREYTLWLDRVRKFIS